jgi:DNA-binding MarR family transcriptional regulator
VSSDHELVERFLLRLAEYGHTVTEAMAASTKDREFITNTPLLVLCVLDLEGPKRPGALQDLVGLTSGGTSKLLDRMEHAGLIRRTYGTIDRDNRGVEVTLTARGRRLIRRATSSFADFLPETKAMVKELVGIVDELDSLGRG